jgi:hypothetical protein
MSGTLLHVDAGTHRWLGSRQCDDLTGVWDAANAVQVLTVGADILIDNKGVPGLSWLRCLWEPSNGSTVRSAAVWC